MIRNSQSSDASSRTPFLNTGKAARSRRGQLRRAVGALEGLEARQLLTGLSTIVDPTGELLITNYQPTTHTVYDAGKTLTKAKRGTMQAVAVSYLQSHAADFGLTAKDVAAPIVTDHYSDDLTGITHVYLRQSLNGLPILNADMVINLMPDGSIISAAGSFVPNAHAPIEGTTPKSTASSAVAIAAKQLSLASLTPAMKTKSASTALARSTVLSAPTVSQDAIDAQLRYIPTAHGLELAWNFAIRTADNDHWYNVAVGDASQKIVFANDWVDNASYNAIPRPNESPNDGGFVVVTDPQDPVASPFGWHDTNGVAGPEFTDTRGNNVDSHLDRVSDDVPDGTRPDGGASLNFTGYTLSPTSSPTLLQNQNIAQENLFYEVNTAHDIHYRYGFNEAAGNFQVNDYGKGGIGGDAVMADAQDGGGTNNANFGTPPDGQSGRMQMYLWNFSSPNRDGDLDSSVIFHEFGHGVSNRLTGGPSNSDALNATQSGGMGEGWSDFWALMMLQRSTDTQTTSIPVGAYSYNNTNGLRRYPYNYNMSVNPLTIDAYGDSGTSGTTTRSLEAHDTGEIWTSVLWDMNWNLINKYGFESNLANGLNPANIKGNALAMQLVADALKLQPANPSFKDSRDALLQADANLHATLGTPSNAAEIWSAFARRGMGTGFVDNGSGALNVTASFALPVADPTVTSTLPATTISSFSTISVRFDQPMNTSSFSLADDLVSFTTPTSATKTPPTITGYTWTDSTTLQLQLSTAAPIRGVYTLVLGPNILAADDGHAMDTDRDGTPGEAVDDRYTATINYSASVGPDGYGYKAAEYPYENINLNIGDSGVVTLLNNVALTSSSSSAAMNIGANTFNFYGTTYTGTQLFASIAGLVTFGSKNTQYYNDAFSDISTVPQAAIAALWSVWRVDINGAGGGDSALLYKVDTANNRLIVEWSDVATYYDTGAATFQVILQLNTGSTPGRIFFNYVDLDVGSVSSFGNYSTAGIKTAGSPGANRLLVNLDSDQNPWLKNGHAVELALDVTAPKPIAQLFRYDADQQIAVGFDESIANSLGLSDFVLTNVTTGEVVSSESDWTVSTDGNGYAFLKSGHLLADGNYVLTAKATDITDASGNPIDGDGDGAIGGDYKFSFFVLAGDFNHDRKVDFSDLVILAQSYNQTGKDFAHGNANYSTDGKVDFADLVILAQHYNMTLAAPAALVASVVPSDKRKGIVPLPELA